MVTQLTFNLGDDFVAKMEHGETQRFKLVEPVSKKRKRRHFTPWYKKDPSQWNYHEKELAAIYEDSHSQYIETMAEMERHARED